MKATPIRNAGARAIYDALVSQGFPDDTVRFAVSVKCPGDDDPRYLGWTIHLPEVREYALTQMRSKLDTYDFDINQLRSQAIEKQGERDGLENLLAVLAAPVPRDDAGRRDGVRGRRGRE